MTNDSADSATDETLVTEITLQPDGRVYVFGTSRDVLALLADLQPNDPHVRELLASSAATTVADDPPP